MSDLRDSISFEHHRVCVKDFLLPQLRSDFTVARVTADAVWLVDQCEHSGRMSVTNDAEAVVKHCLKHFPNRRIYYRDTQGHWDELQHNGKEFTQFAPARDMGIPT